MILYKVASDNNRDGDSSFLTSAGMTGAGTLGAYNAYKVARNQTLINQLKDQKEINKNTIDMLKKHPGINSEELDKALKGHQDSINGIMDKLRKSRNKNALVGLGALGGIGALHVLKNKKENEYHNKDDFYSGISNDVIGSTIAGLGAAGTGVLSAYHGIKGNKAKSAGYLLATLPLAATSGILYNHAERKALDKKNRKYLYQ